MSETFVHVSVVGSKMWVDLSVPDGAPPAISSRPSGRKA
jgi:hypothetical protein